MNKQAEKHLARAETLLARGDESYGKAADEILAAQKSDPMLTQKEIGERFGKSSHWVSRLVSWRTSGDPGTPPFGGKSAEDKGRGTVEARRILMQSPKEEIAEIISNLPEENVTRIAEAVEDIRVQREVYGGKRPDFTEAQRKARAKDAKILKANPSEAAARFGSALGRGRAQTRVIVQGYQDFLALIEDEDIRDYVRERFVSYRADVDLALGEALDGSIEEAFARLLEEEVK